MAMSSYNYTDDEKDILKVLGMQDSDLKNLENSIDDTSSELAVLRKKIEEEARKRGVSPVDASPQTTDDESFSIPAREIPTWESLMERAVASNAAQPEIEDLLSAQEIQYTLDEITRINQQFKEKTRLGKVDLAFLVIATLLQTLRWVIINKIMGDIGQKIDADTRLDHNDDSIKKKSGERKDGFRDKHWDDERKDRASEKGYRSWMQILYETVPYDANKGAGDFGENMEGRYHRYRTLGHDPILGWLFGTANIITDTITLSNWMSYRVARTTPTGSKKLHFSEPTTLAHIFYESYDSVKEDKLRLPAAVFTQFVHLESDAFTKQGLPVPILEAFSEELAGKLYRSQYDSLCLLRDIKIVGVQAVVSVVINMLITLIHGLFYDPAKHGDRDLFEVRTRKILLYSNAMASAGNIAYSVATQQYGKLDVGGIIVTITRLFSDIKFITRVKQDFLQRELDAEFQKEMESLNSCFIENE